MFRAVQRFFGLGGEDDDLAADSVGPARLPSTAFRFGDRLTMKGEIVGEGDLELAGRFEGAINVQGVVVVGDSAEVNADITASRVVIGGKVRGNVSAAGRVEILPQGVLTGNLRTGSLAAAEGASVKGEIVVERAARPKLEVSGSP